MKKIISIALCLVLCFGLCTAVFASEPTIPETPAADAANAGLVKVLDISDQITDPGITFTFSFAAAASTDNCTGSDFTKTIASTAMTVYGNQKAGKLSFADMDFINHGITHAGIWSWTVTESATVEGFSGSPLKKVTTLSDGTVITDTLTMDTSTYTVNVDVINGTDGTPAIAGYTVYKGPTKEDPGFEYDVPGVPGTEGTAGQTRLGSGFEFENTLTETKKGPEGGDGALNVSKSVVVAAGSPDRADRTKPFAFTLKLIDHNISSSGSASTMTAATARIVRDDKQPIAKLADGTAAPNSVEIPISASGTATTFYLSDGDKLIIDELPVGVTYEVVETSYTAENYTSSLTDNKASGSIASATNEAVAVTNTFEAEPITGIVVNNLPFVLIVLLAVSGVAVYFVSNRRREQED